MPVQLFTEAERARRNRFPDVIAYEDLVTFFTLSERDLRSIPRSREPHNRLGYALQLCTLRFMGFVPDDLRSAPPDAVTFVAQQLAVAPHVLAAYGAGAQTRQEHLLAVQTHLGYRKVGRDDVRTLADWLLERALEHDKPTLLYELACEKLRTEQLVRPGVTRLERLVAETRERAQEETFHQLTPLLTDDCQRFLDTLLEPDVTRGMTPLAWLRRPPVSNSPKAILANLEKLTFLRATAVEAWSLAALNPNHLTFLAQLARKSSAQALQRAPTVRRYPLLVAFLVHALATVTDEVLEMFDRCLAEAYARAGKDLEDFRKTMAQATNEKVHLFRDLARAVLDPAITDPHLRPAIYQRLTPADLRRAADEADRLVRPLDDSYFDFFETRYGYLRQCTPTFLETVAFQSTQEPDPLLQAVAVLHQLNTTHRCTVPSDAPTDFVPLKWRPYVFASDNRIDRHYYELCTLWELRGALRAGNVWVPHSRRYAHPETYLIPPPKWPALRPEVCEQIHAPADGAVRLEQRGRELVDLLPRVERMLSRQGPVRIPVAGKIRNATALRRYFLSQGLTFYSWTSDQFAQYGTKVVPATIRDATYVLDAILDNTTELSLVEHTTDTAGYTEIVFALFDLLGMQFAPRLRDIGDQQLYRMSREQKARHLAPRLKGIIKQDFILHHWDDFLRLAGSLKLGWVTASLFISKLQAYPRQNILARALQEYGRLVKTLFILRYLESQDYRRRINAQLNKGESLHALRDFLFVADKGVIRRKQEEAQTNQAMCLNLITNAVVVWNTVYMQAVLDCLHTEGLPVEEDDLAHLSPARFEHVNPYGKYIFPLEQAAQRHGLRPLRAA